MRIRRILLLLLLSYQAGAMAQMIGVNGGAGGGAFSNPGAVVSLDPNTGNGTILGTPFGGVGLAGVAASPNGRVFAVTGFAPDGTNHLIEIDPFTGALINDIGSLLDSGGDPCAINDLSYRPGTGTLFAMAANNNNFGTNCGIGGSTGGYLLTINTVTAQYTVIGRDPGLGNNSGGITFASDGTLYFTPGWNTVGNLHTLDTATGNILTTVALSQLLGFHGLEIDPTTGIMYASLPMDDNCCQALNNNIYTIDPTNGNVSLLGTPGGSLVHDMTFLGTVGVVPALNYWGLAVVALLLGGIGAVRLVRKSTA